MAHTFAGRLAVLLLLSMTMTSAYAQDDFSLDEDDCDTDDIDSDDTQVEAELLGLCEVPSVSTAAQGRFTGTIDDATGSIEWNLAYRNLETPVQQAHIHLGQEHTNGGVIVFLCSNLETAPPGVQACPIGSGSISGTITADQIVGPAEQGIAPGEMSELIAAMRAGATYANVHTMQFPMGEIRGQIVEDDDDDDDD